MKKLEKTIYEIDVESRQIVDDGYGTRGIDGVIEPFQNFDDLLTGYEQSFSIGGIVNKFASSASKGFSDLPTDVASEQETKTLQNFLESIDLKTMFTEIFVTGNHFIEIARGKGTQTEKIIAERFLIESIRITEHRTESDIEKNTPYSYLHRHYSGSSVAKEVFFDFADVLHFKNESLRNKFYGSSQYFNCVEQVVLLAKIDRFYANLLNKGNIKTKLLVDSEGKLTDAQKHAIKTVIQQSISGLENSFNTAIIPTKLEKLDLQDDVETNAFLQYRNDLIESICIACNFPFDLLISKNSNRSVAEVAKETLNNDLVIPMQKMVLQQLKKHLKYLNIFSESLVDEIAFLPVDINNEIEGMNVLTGYVNSGIMTPNEARLQSIYDLGEVEGGNLLKKPIERNFNTEAPEYRKIEKAISNRYDTPNVQ